MQTADFLFPKDLRVTDARFKRVLFVGSCLSEALVEYFRSTNRTTQFDHVLFNHVGDMPCNPPVDLSFYDFQLVQLPLRTVLTDAFLDLSRLSDRSVRDEMISSAFLRLDQMVDAALRFNTDRSILTFVFNFIVPQERIAPSLKSYFTDQDIVYLVERLNLHLAGKLAVRKNAFVADINMVAGSLGKKFFLDDFIYFYLHGGFFHGNWHAQENFPPWTAPDRGRIENVPPMEDYYECHRDEFLNAVYGLIDSLFRIVNQIDQVKIVIFDLDDTMWRGQIAEHYRPGMSWPHMDGWPTGIWDAVHQLRSRGILTSICSKNDLEVVQKNWGNAVRPPLVRLEHFVAPKINWLSKVENIASILAEVGLTAKSAVFVDDNPVERAAVKTAFPEIRVIGANPFLIKRILLWSSETQVSELTDESERRESMIFRQLNREQHRSTMSREEFLASLESRISFVEVKNSSQNEFSRCLELMNKTNQFNTTGQRWSHADIEDFLVVGGRLICFAVKDKYVEYGIVGAVLIQQNEIKQFVMSCRVLGLGIEYAAITEIVTIMRIKANSAKIIGSTIVTDSNMPCRELFARSGFLQSTEDGQIYELPADMLPIGVTHVAVISLDSQPDETTHTWNGEVASQQAVILPTIERKTSQLNTLDSTREDVIAAYKIFLQRHPENSTVIDSLVGVPSSQLLAIFTNSKEFLISNNLQPSSPGELAGT